MKKLRRHKGTIGTIEAIIITVAISSIAVAFMSQNAPIISRGNAESIARKYIIKGQQQGFLSTSDVAELTRKLQDKGCKNVSIKTVNNKVKYGDDIDLIVEYDIDVKEIKTNENAFPTFQVNTKRVKIDKSTIGTAT